jgi:dihydrofolate reductase
MKATVYVGASVDGFIAREDGGIDWLTLPGEAESSEDHGFQEFMDTVDALVMGRNTYDLVRTFGEWPYGDKPVIVLSSRDVEIPENLTRTVESMSAPPREVVRRLAERGFQHLYVDGGKTIQAFLREGLITRLVITRLPVLIGAGIPLFGPLSHDVRLRHVETRQYENGMVRSTYEVMGGA